MSREISRAPQERVNIVYRPATGDAKDDRELPLKILMLGDYTGAPDSKPVEDRSAISVNKDNFGEVMAQQRLSLDISVPEMLSSESGTQADPDATLGLQLRFASLKDFEPEGIVRQVEPMRQLLQLRAALNALKGPMGNNPAFRRKIEALLNNGASRKRLSAELGMPKTDGDESTGV